MCVAYDLPGRVFSVSGSRPGFSSPTRLLPDFQGVGFSILVLPLGLRILALALMGWKASARVVDLNQEVRKGGELGVILDRCKQDRGVD